MAMYGVRGPDLRNTVVAVPTKDAAMDMLMPGDVLMFKTGDCPHASTCGCGGGWRACKDDNGFRISGS
jgi:hypothetical protein